MPNTSNIEFVTTDSQTLTNAGAQYSVRNYVNKSAAAAMRRRRFQTALKMSEKVETNAVIDMGCCDGILLPTLSKYFDRVAAIDIHPGFIDICNKIASSLELDVTTVCSQGLSNAEVRSEIGDDYRLMFVLETLEHVGNPADMWPSKIDFLHECFGLLEKSRHSRIIASVPKMVGFGFLVKHVAQTLRGNKDDAMPWKNVFQSAFLNDTNELESRWNGGHVGFNHLKLEQAIASEFCIHKKVNSLFSCFYEIGRSC